MYIIGLWLTSLPMSPFFTMYSLLRKSLGLMERASSLVKPISVFWNRGTCRDGNTQLNTHYMYDFWLVI